MNPTSEAITAGPVQAGRVVDYMRETAPRPMTAGSMARELDVGGDRRKEFDELLERLVSQGRLVKTRDGRFGVPEKMNLVVGSLSCHADGYGFVVPRDGGDQPDLYVPGRKLGNAMHGDLVIARKEHVRRSGKVEGSVIRVLERARKQVVGKFERSRNFGYVVPIDERLVYDVYIPEAEINGAKQGQVVCAEITDYPEGSRNPEGKIVDVLGAPDDPRIDVEIVIREHQLPHRFPDEVLAETEGIATEVSGADVEGRTDFRDLPIVTIDGENAKDFDDAVHVERFPDGTYRLAVHIADVAAYVPVGSAIDLEAQERGTSVYFPDRVVPMLPERLSNEICSLKPGVDRLVQSVIMEIDPDGRTLNYEFHDGVIRSAARMTYTDVAKILDGDEETEKKHADHVAHFHTMAELCEILRKYRARRGSIDFDLPEPEILINLRGEVEDVLRSERNLAHRIIEEFMIRANEVVASHTTWEALPSLYRVHDGPDPERIERFREFIAGLGLQLGGGREPKPEHFQRLVRQIEGMPGERVIVYQMLRTMKQAEYDPDNRGHFGLASERYSHFTSPIRRYPDLIVHRLLRRERGSDKQADFEAEALVGCLPRIAEDSSERERNAEEAERRYVDWKRVQFMADKVGDTFEALITGVHSFGFFVELEPYFVEGLVHVSSLDDDFYRFDEAKHRLRGENHGRMFTLGSRVEVQLVRVDRARRRIDFVVEKGPLAPPKVERVEEQKKADKEQATAAEERPKGRRRRRRRKGGGREAATDKGGEAQRRDDGGAEKAQAQPQAQDKEAAQEKGGAASGQEAAGKKARRRRSSRRGRRGAAKKQADKGAAKKEATKEAAKKGAAKQATTKAAAKKAGDAKRAASKGDAGKKGERGKAAAGKGQKRSGRPSRRRRKPAAKGKAAEPARGKAAGAGAADSGRQAKPATQKAEEPKKEEKPSARINPYLTDL